VALEPAVAGLVAVAPVGAGPVVVGRAGVGPVVVELVVAAQAAVEWAALASAAAERAAVEWAAPESAVVERVGSGPAEAGSSVPEGGLAGAIVATPDVALSAPQERVGSPLVLPKRAAKESRSSDNREQRLRSARRTSVLVARVW
jgi:hypothetical protein